MKTGNQTNEIDPARAPCVCVIIAAMNAEETVGMAVTSALAQPEVQEVVLIDDASTDRTAERAEAAANGDIRLRVLRQSDNLGPAAARNLAISKSSAPFIAILDADDALLDGRFSHLLAEEGWDLIADNIVFLHEEGEGGFQPPAPVGRPDHMRILDLSDFVAGNISQRGRARGELGFLKPVVRRAFLEDHNLTYDPALRLGEDYDLYVRALLCGARFKVSARVGYAARVRANSLSGAHRTADLQALLAASHRHLQAAGKQNEAVEAMSVHHSQVRARFLLRAFLDRKATDGALSALSFAFLPPSNSLPIIRGVLSDKLKALRPGGPVEPISRYLMPVQAEGQAEASA